MVPDHSQSELLVLNFLEVFPNFATQCLKLSRYVHGNLLHLFSSEKILMYLSFLVSHVFGLH